MCIERRSLVQYDSTKEGILIAVRDEHLSNVLACMDLTNEEITMEGREVHPLKAYMPMHSIVRGRLTFTRDLQPWKEWDPTDTLPPTISEC